MCCAFTLRPAVSQCGKQTARDRHRNGVFSQVLGKRKREDAAENEETKKKKGDVSQDPEYYVPYRPKDFESERGLSIASNSFEQAAAGAVLDLLGDQTEDLRKTKHIMKWDRKKKKFVGAGGHEDKKKIKTESGRVISSSYKTNIYEDWKKKYKIDDQDSEEEEDRQTGKSHRKGRGTSSDQDPDPESDGPLDLESPGYQSTIDSLIEAVNQSLQVDEEPATSRTDNFVSFKRTKHTHRVFANHPEFQDIVQ
ncbi:unnamed protein product [Ranitomeya imitator]|uniref:DBP10 C-terminal domain-containing protein n=1 Tax=Ranitomeya imitator TaxID=111125 RepID=A0ABN9L0L2_9NEOB|nr:unnamed protein product [Ranitomeya imitator]